MGQQLNDLKRQRDWHLDLQQWTIRRINDGRPQDDVTQLTTLVQQLQKDIDKLNDKIKNTK